MINEAKQPTMVAGKTSIRRLSKVKASSAYNSKSTSSAKSSNKKVTVEGEPRNVFRFMDLPPELRNEIYKLLLIARKEICVIRHAHSLEVYTVGARINGKHRHAVGIVLKLAILLVNKTIHDESTPIFYGANHFSFSTSKALSYFQRVAGTNFGLLKEIHVRSFTLCAGTDLTKGLCGLQAPTGITLNVPMESRDVNYIELIAAQLGAEVRPFVQDPDAWLNRRRDNRWYSTLAQYPDINEPEQRERFDKLRFLVVPGRKMVLEDKTIIQANSKHDFHETISRAILEAWEDLRRS